MMAFAAPITAAGIAKRDHISRFGLAYAALISAVLWSAGALVALCFLVPA